MANSTNSPTFHPARIVVSGARQTPRMQAHAILVSDTNIEPCMAQALELMLRGGPVEALEIHAGSVAFATYQRHLRTMATDPTYTGPNKQEIRVFHVPGLADAQMVFLSYRGD